MTEAEWLSGEWSAGEMIDHLQEIGRADARKLRLYACACARRLWGGLGHKTHGRVVELAEDFADGLLPFEELAEAVEVASEYREEYQTEYDQAEICPGRVVFATADRDAASAAQDAYYHAADVAEYLSGVPGAQEFDGVGLVREIFGNPLQSASLGVADVGGTVADLARVAYLERILPGGELDPARLLVLADALEEAGCEDSGILDHLRSPGRHVRGCWVVDLILEQAGGFPAPSKRRRKRAVRPGEGRVLHTAEDILAAAARLTAPELARVQEGLRRLEEERASPRSSRKRKPG